MGGAPDSLLDSYEEERRPNVRRWTELSIEEGAISCVLDPVKAAERDARMLAGQDLSHHAPPDLDRGVFALGPDGVARRPAGTLGPQGRVRASAGEGRFDDLFGSPRFTVLTRGGAAADVLDEPERELLERLGAVAVEIVAAEAEPGEGQAADLAGVYADYFDAHDATAVVVRPDFYVFGVVADLGELPALLGELGSVTVNGGQRELLTGIKFAESPRWHEGRLWFSDVHDYAVKCVDVDGVVARVAEVPGRPAGMGFLPDGRLLLATALDKKLVLVDTSGGGLTEVADLSDLAQGTLNDMVVDERGRAYVGDVGFQFGKDEPRPGRVILWTEGEGPRVAAEDTTFPNGCAVDGDRYVLAETLAKRVSEFKVAADGTLTDRKVLAELNDPPDGLCLDADGAVWVAQPEESRYLRLGRDGEIDAIVPSASPFAVTCVLGGEDGRTLFLSSADTDLKRLPKGDTTGRIDTLRVPTPRVRPPLSGGPGAGGAA